MESNITPNILGNLNSSVDDVLSDRKNKTINFLKQKKDWIYYLILSFLVFISVYIRTRNISKLKDIVTGTWTLGPDLDPFLFLRWAEDIVQNGKLMVWDMMRYVPIGYNTAGEMKLLSYMIAWFYHFLSFFSKEVTVTYTAIIFPVVMFALTTIAFFLFARKIFYKEDKNTRNIIGLIATAFFIVIPSLLSRTIAGIPEKESAAFFFMFMSFYLFLEAFTSKNLKKGLIFGILSGLTTGILALIWGGVIFVFFAIPLTVLFAFLLGKIKKDEFYIYSLWMISSFLTMIPFSTRYSLMNLISSTSTLSAISVFIIIAMSLFIIIDNPKLKGIKRKTKISEELFSVLFVLSLLFLIALIFLGPNFILNQISHVKSSLISPATSRFGLTVAENRQPYFASEWKSNFGPIMFNVPLFFWLFFIGSITLFANLINRLTKKEKLILIGSYFIFLICLIFSRYSQESILNGTSGLSLLTYFGGVILFLGSLVYVYYKKYQEGGFQIFKKFNISYILYFIILTLGIIGARGGIRLIMVLGAISPVAIAFLIVKSSKRYFKEKDDSLKFFMGVLAIMILTASIFIIIGNPLLMFKGTNFWSWGGYYQEIKLTADNFAPGSYQWQWQNAMAWVRENTSENAVFAHWWDYGYWLQSIGKRATILDGGNSIGYWNHLMGRYVLTGPNESEALEFLYAHNGTHLLIDSTEIGKYTAYSSIGSDENYDRFSWIPTILMDEKQTQETKNETIYVYPGGSTVDEDIIWIQDDKEIFLPRKGAGLGAVIVRINSEEIVQKAEGIYFYKGNQYIIPLRYLYINGNLIDFQEGIEAGAFIFPRIDIQSGGANVNKIGAMFYLSSRTIHSQLARLYLFDQKSDYFKLAHSEDNLFIKNLKAQGVDIGEFVYYQGFQGPIKIWEIQYHSDIKVNPEYLETSIPDEISKIKEGEYN
ncbi:MAG: STT3 domain-containing protein [archaeon]